MNALEFVIDPTSAQYGNCCVKPWSIVQYLPWAPGSWSGGKEIPCRCGAQIFITMCTKSHDWTIF